MFPSKKKKEKKNVTASTGQHIFNRNFKTYMFGVKFTLPPSSIPKILPHFSTIVAYLITSTKYNKTLHNKAKKFPQIKHAREACRGS